MDSTKTSKEGELFGSVNIQGTGIANAAMTNSDSLGTDMPKRRGRRPKVKVWEERPTLTKIQMRELLCNLGEIESVTGIKYVDLRITHKMIIGIRQTSGKEFTINTDQLYDAYCHCLQFTSPEVKKIIFMGHSPAVAILRWLKAEQNKRAEPEMRANEC